MITRIQRTSPGNAHETNEDLPLITEAISKEILLTNNFHNTIYQEIIDHKAQPDS